MPPSARDSEETGSDHSHKPAARRAKALGWNDNKSNDGLVPDVGAQSEMERLKEENRRLAISLGGFSAFIASRGLLEDAWHFIHNIHQEDDGRDRE